ncbi:MAG: hypothetical protein R3309_04930 [Reinekea sp.]|nr:hypothetical protein [Reinekea sp.]
MAKNENTSRPNRNTFVAAVSGGGKSQAARHVRENLRIKRVLAWDPDHDHQVSTRVTSIRALTEFLKVHGDSSAFSVAYSGDDSPEAMELFCACAWAILDGNKETVVIIEEVADAMTTSGKALPNAGRLIRRIRKYGGVLIAVTQRPQEIPKTLFSQCNIKLIGQQDTADVKRMAERVGVPVSEIENLQELEFWMKDTGKPAEKIRVKYKAKPKK